MNKDQIPKELLMRWGLNTLRSGWTNIPNTLLQNQGLLGLSNTEITLIIQIMSFAHSCDTTAFPSIATLSERTNQHPRTIQRTIGRLVKKGFIEKVVRSKHANDIGLSNLYNLEPLRDKLAKLSKDIEIRTS